MDLFASEISRLGHGLFSVAFNHRPYVLDPPDFSTYQPGEQAIGIGYSKGVRGRKAHGFSRGM